MPATKTAKKHPIRPEDNYLLRSVFDPQVSPDGTRVAYLVRSADKSILEITRASVAAMHGEEEKGS